MATNCDVCGIRTNEVKSGGGIEPKGIKIEVKVSKLEDFSRDLLKSETCSLSIPELELEVGCNTFGGKFTTVEGIIVSIKEQLGSSGLMFKDSEDPERQAKMNRFLKELNEILECKKPITLILDDPAGNSYVQSMTDTDEADGRLKIIYYERTFQQNEDLGLNDIKTENY